MKFSSVNFEVSIVIRYYTSHVLPVFPLYHQLVYKVDLSDTWGRHLSMTDQYQMTYTGNLK